MKVHRSRQALAALIAAVLLAVPLAGCGGGSPFGGGSEGSGGLAAPAEKGAGSPAVGGYEASPEAQRSAAPAQDAAKAVASADRMVIRNANLRLEVKEPKDGVEELRALAKKYGGEVANLVLATDTDGEPIPYGGPDRAVRSGMPFTASMTLLVPVAKFDAFRAEAVKLGKVLSESSADEDVTQQHVDLKARLANLIAEEARLRSFFDDAKSVNDMLNIERELARVRGDIESMTAQLKTLERQAAMATLTIELVEPEAIVKPSSGIDWGFREALRTGIQGMVGILKGIIVLAIASAPVWISALLAFFIIRWRLRAKRIRPNGTEPVDAEQEG